MKKMLAAAGIATVIGATGLTSVGIVNAASTTNTSTDPMSSLVDAIASKFNLSKSDVQSVFDAQRTEMEAQHETKVKAKVAQLVTDGKLTQDQADKINAKRAELQKEREANKTTDQSKTREEMKTEMDAKRTTLEAWAKENGIDTTYLRYVFGGGPGHGHGGPGGMHESSDDSTDTSAGSTTTN
jgi:Skp family chaperone for outer membrane proteins